MVPPQKLIKIQINRSIDNTAITRSPKVDKISIFQLSLQNSYFIYKEKKSLRINLPKIMESDRLKPFNPSKIVETKTCNYTTVNFIEIHSFYNKRTSHFGLRLNVFTYFEDFSLECSFKKRF